jgi:hypothetical protein
VLPYFHVTPVNTTSVFHFEQHPVIPKTQIMTQLLEQVGLQGAFGNSLVPSIESRELVFKALSAVDNNYLITSPVDRFVDVSNIRTLYEYRVPMLNAEGTCSNVEQLSQRPFNLAVDAYKIMSSFDSVLAMQHPMTLRLKGNNI